MTTGTIRAWASHPMLDVVDHICRDCRQPYTDNSRTSLRCPICRQAHKREYNRERNQRKRKERNADHTN